MPNYTTKLNLEKPLGNEFYNIEVHNSNSDKIDAFANEIELRKLNKTGDTADDLKVTKVPVDLLDTVRKKELNSMAGGEIKGYIEDGGSHLVGEVWLSKNNIGEFKCLTTNTDTYIDAAKWLPIDDLTNAGKLKNLNDSYAIGRCISYSNTGAGGDVLNFGRKIVSAIAIHAGGSENTNVILWTQTPGYDMNNGVIGFKSTYSTVVYYVVYFEKPF